MCSVTLGSAPSQRENCHENLKHLDHVLTAGNLTDAYKKYEEIRDRHKNSFISLLYWGHQIRDTKYANASYFLGLMFLKGSYGVMKDASQAFDYFQEAALRHCLSAQINCARMLYYGNGVQKDKGAAYNWFLRAGYDGGDMESLFIAGKMLIMGDGVSIDIDRGQNLINYALNSGYQLPKHCSISIGKVCSVHAPSLVL